MIDPNDDIPIQLAETLVSVLNIDFAGVFISEFDFVVENDVKELKDLKVTIVPGGLDASELLDRGATVENDWLVGIGFQQRVSRKGDVETKAILKIVRQVRDYINRNRIITIGDDEFLIESIESRPYLDQELLLSGHFYSAIVLTIREWEDLD